MRRPLAWALAALPLLLLIPPLRQLLESRMAPHMLVELPLLFVAGWALARALGPRARLPAAIDAHGLLGLTWVSAVSALWMIPSMLDLSLLDARLQWAKYLAWWLAGGVGRGSLSRAGPVVGVFFLGNIAWMLATAGLLYQDEEQRLCVSYLVDEQAVTGKGLIVLALLLAGLALHRVAAAPRPAAAAAAIQPGERLTPDAGERTSGMIRR